jgi:hypothetical protein
VEYGVLDVWSRVDYTQTGGEALSMLERNILSELFKHYLECIPYLMWCI